MGIKIIDPGMFTTVQDFGMIGYQNLGFSVCGAMDTKSLAIANMLVNNKEDEAGLEVTLIGPKMKFTKTNIIAITGGNLNPKINGKQIPMYKAIIVKENDVLSLEYAKSGARSYISFAGGLSIEKIMGSKSTNIKCCIGGHKGRILKSGDFIKFTSPKEYISNYLSKELKYEEKESKEIILRVILGPQDDAFTDEGIDTFLNSKYEITNEFDRMGCRLDGSKIQHKISADIISDGIALGSIQVPSHGKPIIMLTDRQTIGGYTKIATVISSDIRKIAQSKAKDIVKFEKISLEDAQLIYKEEIKNLNEIREKINKPCMEILNPRLTSKRIERLLNTNF